MNVLIITAVGGFLQKFLMQDVEMLLERGHTVHYASNFDNPIYECDRNAIEKMGIKCYNIMIAKSPFSFSDNIKAYNELNKIVRDEKIDMLYLHNPMGGVLGRMLKQNNGLIVVYTAHGFHFYKGGPIKNWLFYYTVEKILARRTDAIITINREDEAAASKFKMKKNGFVARIPGIGVDTKRFYPNQSNKSQEGSFVFLSVGELNNNKNHATIIKAFAKANMSDARLIICGEGPAHSKLKSLIEELDVGEKVSLMGYQSNIEEYHRLSDVFVFPSIREGLGMAAVEAMASGLPLIVANNRGTREYAFDNAIVCEATDVEAFASAMMSLYGDRNLLHKMSRRSIEISKNFTRKQTGLVMSQVFTKLEDIYGN